MAGEVPGAPDRGQEGPAADPEVVGRGGHREGVVDGVRGRRSARSIGFTAARERLPALRLRPVGPPVEASARARRRGDRALRRRLRGGVRASGGRRAVLGGASRQAREVQPGAERREDAADRVRAVRRPRTARRVGSASQRRSGFSGSRTSAGRRGRGVSSSSGSPTQSGCEPSCSAQGRDRATPASAHPRARALARQRPARALPTTTRCPATARRYTPSATEVVRHWFRALRRRSQRTTVTWERMSAPCEPDGYLPPASCTPGPTPASTPSPKAGAQCVSSARWDLCGGRPEPARAKGRPYRDRPTSCSARSGSGPGAQRTMRSRSSLTRPGRAGGGSRSRTSPTVLRRSRIPG